MTTSTRNRKQLFCFGLSSRIGSKLCNIAQSKDIRAYGQRKYNGFVVLPGALLQTFTNRLDRVSGAVIAAVYKVTNFQY